MLNIYWEIQQKSYSKVKNSFIRSLIGDPAGKKFLDIGCGCGFFTNYARNNNASLVVGIDREINALKSAKYYEKEFIGKRSNQYILSDIIPFGKYNCFDIILIKDVIEHINNDSYLIHQVSNLLSENGVLIISTQNSFSLNYLIQGFYYRVFRSNKKWYGWDPTHIRFYTPAKIKKMLLMHNLEITGWRSNYIIPHKIAHLLGQNNKFLRLNFLTIFDKLLGKTFPFNRIGWNIIIKSQKKRQKTKI